jgi:uncharacterized protein (DUF433 family)
LRGDSIDNFLEGFPTVKREQVIASLEEMKEQMLAMVQIGQAARVGNC